MAPPSPRASPDHEPGAVDPAATLNVVCSGTARERRHGTAAEKVEVLAAYNIPPGQAAYYEIDVPGRNAFEELEGSEALLVDDRAHAEALPSRPLRPFATESTVRKSEEQSSAKSASTSATYRSGATASAAATDDHRAVFG